jgi:MFS family permease
MTDQERTHRPAYFGVLGAAIACYAALGAVIRIAPGYVGSTLGSGSVAVGLAVGAPAITGAVLRPLGGRWADRLGSRRMVICGAVVMAVGVVPAFVATLPMLLLSRLLVGGAEAVMMSATVLWLLRIAGPQRRGRSLGHIGLANYAGLTLGPLLVEVLGAQHHVDRVWVLAIVLPLAGAVAALLVQSAPAPTVERSEQATVWSMIRRTGRPGVGLLLVNIGYVAILSFGAAVVASHGLAVGSLIVPVFGAGVIVSRVGLGSFPDRFGAGIVLAVAALVEAIGLLGFAVTGTEAGSVVALVVLSVGQGLAVPALGVLALRSVRAEQHGAAAGAFFAWFDGGVGLGGPLVGAVARLASPEVAIIAAAGAVAAVVPVVLARRHPASAAASGVRGRGRSVRA